MTLASPFVETAPVSADVREGENGRPAVSARLGARGVAAVLSPILATLIALLTHKLLPNRQIDLPTKLYPLLLQVLVGVAAALAVAQWAWRRLRPGVRHYAPLLAGAAAWLTIWDLLTLKLAWVGLPHFPGPDMVLEAIWDDRIVLLASTYDSLWRLLAGYLTGVTVGLIGGTLMGWFRDVRYWGVPVMKIVGPIPATALIPTALVLFPNSPFIPGVVLIALPVAFPVTMLTMSGIINVPASYFDVARSLGAGRGYLIFRVAIPAALPSIFIGLFMGLLASFLVLAVAEAVGVKNGLGYYVEWRRNAAEYDRVFGALFIMSLFFSTILTVLFKVRDRVLGWQKGVIRW